MNATLTLTQLVTSWTWNPSIWLGTAALAAAYAGLVGPLRRRNAWGAPVSRTRQAAFYLGTLIVFIALASPLDRLADEYLLSAHMLQHLLLIMVAPPLWLAGLPDWALDRGLRLGLARSALLRLTRPVTAFIIFNGVVLLWHLPALYNAALVNEGIHILEHLAFMAAAVIGWWPMLGPSRLTAPRASQPAQMFYMFLCMFPCTALAAVITFASVPPYPFYTSVPRLWGISVQEDQQISGLVMWLPWTMIFFVFLSAVFVRWFNNPSAQEDGVES